MSKHLRMTLARENSLNWSEIEKRLSYNPDTGLFSRVFKNRGVRRYNNYHGSGGYVYITLEGQLFHAERLAWRLYYGEWPPMKVKFLNGNKDDLRIVNLTLEDPLM